MGIRLAMGKMVEMNMRTDATKGTFHSSITKTLLEVVHSYSLAKVAEINKVCLRGSRTVSKRL